jgi:hypothetical protein
LVVANLRQGIVSETRPPFDGARSIPQRPDRPLVGEVVPEAELEDDLRLAPPIERSREELVLSVAEEDEADDDDGLPEPSQQFTLRDIMLLTFLAAVGFAVLRLCPPAMFAGTMGGVAILGLAVLSIAKPEKIIFHLVWWTILGIYIIASVIAVMTK